MPKSTTITKEIIIKTAFEIARKEGFAVLSARNIAKQIGCSTQPIYWSYKNMDDLKAEVCQKALSHLKNTMCQYKQAIHFWTWGLDMCIWLTSNLLYSKQFI